MFRGGGGGGGGGVSTCVRNLAKWKEKGYKPFLGESRVSTCVRNLAKWKEKGYKPFLDESRVTVLDQTLILRLIFPTMKYIHEECHIRNEKAKS